MKKTKNVALVLSSGGARGYAHIGAIEELEARGYHITSVVGASMGALVGAMYCAGRLDQMRDWVLGLTRREILSLIDWSPGFNHIVRGNKLMKRLREIVPDVRIEGLSVPFRAVASDLTTQREVVFSKGSLFRAVRASISIPAFLKPVRVGDHILVDGGLTNPLPINRAVRLPDDDLLISVNVSAPASVRVREAREALRRVNRERSFLSMERLTPAWLSDEPGGNYVTLLASSIDLAIQRNTVLMRKLYRPDVEVEIPMNRYGVFDFDMTERIIRSGRSEMAAALDAWEAGAPPSDAPATTTSVPRVPPVATSRAIHVRHACPADIPALLRLLVEINRLHHEGRPDLFTLTRKYDQAALLSLLADPGYTILVAATPADEVCGYAICRLENPPHNAVLKPVRTYYLDDLCVDVSARGCGIGHHLIEAVRSEARQAGCYNLTLNVWACNESARQFYERCGFKVQKTTMEELL